MSSQLLDFVAASSDALASVCTLGLLAGDARVGLHQHPVVLFVESHVDCGVKLGVLEVWISKPVRQRQNYLHREGIGCAVNAKRSRGGM